MTEERRPWTAAVLNLLLPGLGHLYVGRPGMAVGLSLLSVFTLALLYAGAMFVWAIPLNVVLPLLLVAIVAIGGCIHAALIAKATRRDYSLRPYNRWYVYAGVFLVLGVPTPALVKTHLIEAYRAPSGSMYPTTQRGDFLYVTKWPRNQRRPVPGRMVVFESKEERGLKIIKRIVGMPGDTLQMRLGKLYRNGSPMSEPYVVHIDLSRTEDAIQRTRMKQWQLQHLVKPVSDYEPDLQTWGPLIVPSDSFFALGDNRDASYDSRYYGFVSTAKIIGRPSVIYFSFDPQSTGPFVSRVRWPRIGHLLN